MVITISQRFKVPAVVGYLLTGVLVGPTGLGLIGEPEQVEAFAELGVVFLLFVVGLELSIERLREVGRFLVVAGPLQAVLTGVMAAGGALLFGFRPAQAAILGAVVSLSSTALVLKRFSDRRELGAVHAKAATGILLFQDLLIVPLLVVVPLLAGSGGETISAVALRFALGLVTLGIVAAAGKYLLPFAFRLVIGSRVRELLVLGSLVACLGFASITERLGFSLALGAFLAGVWIAESDFHHQVLAETAPFRDVFTGVFFLSIGMLFDLDVALAEPAKMLAIALGLVVLKAVAATIAIRLVGMAWSTALAGALTLAQIGEFSFVLVGAALKEGLVDQSTYQAVIASAVLTMIATPVLMAWAPRIASRIGTGVREQEVERQANHVVIAGFGLNGRHLAKVLREVGLAYSIIDLDGRRVRSALEKNEPIVFGDSTRREILEAAGVAGMRAGLVALSEPAAVRRTVRAMRELAPEALVIARADRQGEIDELRSLGADEVVAKEFETSIELLTRLLSKLHVPRNIIRMQARLLRAGGYEMLRTPSLPDGLSSELQAALSESLTETFLIAPEHQAAGRSIRALGIRQATGATVIAVLRGSETITSPEPDLVFEVHDRLVLVGAHEQIDRALVLLGRKD